MSFFLLWHPRVEAPVVPPEEEVQLPPGVSTQLPMVLAGTFGPRGMVPITYRAVPREEELPLEVGGPSPPEREPAVLPRRVPRRVPLPPLPERRPAVHVGERTVRLHPVRPQRVERAQPRSLWLERQRRQEEEMLLLLGILE